MASFRTGMAVLAGGAAGAVCRSGLDAWITDRLALSFPVGILIVNVLGAFCMGMLFGAINRSSRVHDELFALLGTGFLGGFTTFSTFSLQTFLLYRLEGPESALLNCLLNISAGLLAVWCGSLLIPRRD